LLLLLLLLLIKIAQRTLQCVSWKGGEGGEISCFYSYIPADQLSNEKNFR